MYIRILTFMTFQLYLNPPSAPTSSWPGVGEEAAAAGGGPQRADQHRGAAGRLHSAAPELLAQPPDQRGGRGEQRPAGHAGPAGQQPDGGDDGTPCSLSAAHNDPRRVHSFIHS